MSKSTTPQKKRTSPSPASPSPASPKPASPRGPPSLRAAVLRELRAIPKFPSRNDTRVNARPQGATSYVGFCLGKVKMLVGGIVDSRFNARFPELLRAAQALMHAHDPAFKFTSIQVNKNMQCSPHKDSGNVGMSYIIGLGDYTGGELVVAPKNAPVQEHDIRGKFLYFDGCHNTHSVNPFQGERYSLVFFNPRTPAPKPAAAAA